MIFCAKPVEGFEEFRRGFDEAAFRESVPKVLAGSPLAPYADLRPVGGRCFSLTKSRMKLMFYYKNRFAELRDDNHIVLSDLGACAPQQTLHAMAQHQEDELTLPGYSEPINPVGSPVLGPAAGPSFSCAKYGINPPGVPSTPPNVFPRSTPPGKTKTQSLTKGHKEGGEQWLNLPKLSWKLSIDLSAVPGRSWRSAAEWATTLPVLWMLQEGSGQRDLPRTTSPRPIPQNAMTRFNWREA